jgi:hypothetical protein
MKSTFFRTLYQLMIYYEIVDHVRKTCSLQYCKFICHSGRMDSKSIHSTIDAPPGVPGESKDQIFFLQIKLLSSCAKIAPKRHKL